MNRAIINRKKGTKLLTIHFRYDPRIQAVIKKNISGAYFDKSEKCWIVSAYKLKELVDAFKSNYVYFKLTKNMAKFLNVNLYGQTPEEVQRLNEWLKNHPSNAKNYNDFSKYNISTPDGMDFYGYQKAGIHYGIQKNGRVLIGDEMGLGKTVQAIGLIKYYSKDLPAIIAAPASLLYNWKKEILLWCPEIDESDINVIQGTNSKPFGKISIVSYNYVASNADVINQYIGIRGIIVVDECHNIKSMTANRTVNIIQICHSVKRAILMSGTPILNRISELFPQIHAINPELFPDYEKFVYKYCAAHMTKFGLDVSGASHVEELLEILRDNLMVRRLKKDVLTQLPEKRRSTVFIDVSDNENYMLSNELFDQVSTVIDKYLYETNFDLVETKHNLLTHDFSPQEENEDKKKKAKSLLFEAYRLSGLSKLPFILEWVENKINNDVNKLLVFGHHEEFLDTLENKLKDLDIGYIRIDGKVKKEKRFELTEQFQNDDSIQVGVLGLQAASVGLTLTAASNTLIGELPHTPGIALQAEDRTHRDGQKNACNNYYGIANNNIDSDMWNNLNVKNDASNTALDGGFGTDLDESFQVAADGVLETVILSRYNELIQHYKK